MAMGPFIIDVLWVPPCFKGPHKVSDHFFSTPYRNSFTKLCFSPLSLQRVNIRRAPLSRPPASSVGLSLVPFHTALGCAQLLSCVRLFTTPWTAARLVPLSVGFSRQEYWSGLSCPPPGDLSNPGLEPRSPTLQVDSLSSEPPGKKATLIAALQLANDESKFLCIISCPLSKDLHDEFLPKFNSRKHFCLHRCMCMLSIVKKTTISATQYASLLGLAVR